MENEEMFNVDELDCWLVPLNRTLSERDRAAKPYVKKTGSHKNGKPVIQLDEAGEELERFPSVSAAAEAMNVSPAAISKVISGRCKVCAGYKWAFASKSAA